MIKKIEHIGVAVKDLDSSLRFYTEVLGLDCTGVEEVSDQNVKLAIIPIGDTRIELLESTTPDGPIARFIAKHGEGMHHIAYRVENLEDELTRLNSLNIKLIDSKPKMGGDGFRVAFLHPHATHGVLTELCEAG